MEQSLIKAIQPIFVVEDILPNPDLKVILKQKIDFSNKISFLLHEEH